MPDITDDGRILREDALKELQAACPDHDWDRELPEGVYIPIEEAWLVREHAATLLRTEPSAAW
jgi:hypothetical protein